MEIDAQTDPHNSFDPKIISFRSVRLGCQSKSDHQSKRREDVRTAATKLFKRNFASFEAVGNNAAGRSNLSNLVEDRMRWHNDAKPSLELVSEYLRRSNSRLFKQFEATVTSLETTVSRKGLPKDAKSRIKKTFHEVGRYLFSAYIEGHEFKKMTVLLQSRLTRQIHSTDDARPLHAMNNLAGHLLETWKSSSSSSNSIWNVPGYECIQMWAKWHSSADPVIEIDEPLS